MSLDPISIEIIRAKFSAAAERMRITMIKTAHNTVLNEVHDFGCALFNRDVQMIAQGTGIAVFQGHLGFPIQSTIALRNPEDVHEGDVFIHNDPYNGNGNHLNDVAMFAPVFWEQELVGWVAVKAHWIDIGGAVPSSILIDSIDFRQEGLRFQGIKYYDRGIRNEEVLRLIRGNIRVEAETLKDVDAMLAVCRAGEAYFHEIVERYGPETVAEATRRYLDQSERRTRAALREFPDGVYHAAGDFDNDGIDLKRPIRIEVTITIKDGGLTMDCTGSSPQVAGPFNCGDAITISACRLLLKCLTTPEDPADEGSFRPLKVIVPKGSVLAAQEPAPAGRYYVPINLLIELSLRALSEAIPDRVPAGAFADQMPTFFFGSDPETRRPFLVADINGGGAGARPSRDGESGLSVFIGSTARNSPVEVVETRNPYVNIVSFGLRQDSGGKGKYRGGLGIERVFRFNCLVYTTLTLERRVTPPWGLRGGTSGLANEAIIKDAQGERNLRKITRHPVSAGGTITLRTGGGGGVGRPSERHHDAIAQDVRDGYISAAAARSWGE